MKAIEIEEALKDGHKITLSSFMRFKRGKLVRGSDKQYKCGDEVITEKQFDNVRHLLSFWTVENGVAYYKYKGEQ